MSRTKSSPPSPPKALACRTSSTASRTVIMNRVMSSWVTVSGPPSASCRWNSGTTEPAEPKTLPNRTVAKRVPPPEAPNAWI